MSDMVYLREGPAIPVWARSRQGMLSHPRPLAEALLPLLALALADDLISHNQPADGNALEPLQVRRLEQSLRAAVGEGVARQFQGYEVAQMGRSGQRLSTPVG